MRSTIFTLALVAIAALFPLRATAQDNAYTGLRSALERRIGEHKGKVGLALIDLRSRQTLELRGDEPVGTASVIKVPILVEVFHQVEKGKLRLEDPLILLDADKVPGSGILQFLSAPHHLTVKDAAFLMITMSDNTATNLLIDKIGIRSVNARMDSLGLPVTSLFAEVFQRGRTNISPDSSARFGLGVTTPTEMAQLFAMIYRGEAVSASASKQMLEMLRAQFYGSDEIPRHLPPGVSVAHKTGSLDEARHDCGIVFSKERDYVLCVFTTENEDKSWRVDNAGQVLIADLARTVHASLTAGKAE